jgi:hypothetical protein
MICGSSKRPMNQRCEDMSMQKKVASVLLVVVGLLVAGLLGALLVEVSGRPYSIHDPYSRALPGQAVDIFYTEPPSGGIDCKVHVVVRNVRVTAITFGYDGTLTKLSVAGFQQRQIEEALASGAELRIGASTLAREYNGWKCFLDWFHF